MNEPSAPSPGGTGPEAGPGDVARTVSPEQLPSLTPEEGADAIGRQFGLGPLIKVWARRSPLRRRVRGWLALYQGGYADVDMACPRPRAVRWADVTEITFTIRIWPGANSTPSIVMKTFTARPYLGSAMPEPGEKHAARLYKAALQTVGDRMIRALTAAYDAGETTNFGPIHVSQHGIALPGTADPVPWTEIRNVRLRNVTLNAAGPQVTNAVSLARSGRFWSSRVELSGIPNGLFFPAVLRHAAAQHRIPVHGRQQGLSLPDPDLTASIMTRGRVDLRRRLG